MLTIPETLVTMNAAPNPFKYQTNIKYSLNETQVITLEVFNILGQKVSILIEEEMTEAGDYNITFNGVDLPSGLYIATLSGNGFKKVVKLMKQ